MKHRTPFVSKVLCLLLCLFLLLALFACEKKEAKISVAYFDADGEHLTTEWVLPDYDPASRPLPEDTEEWHYTKWEVTLSGDITVCTAKRVAKTKVIFKDFDGTVLKEAIFTEEESEPRLDLPTSTERWIYTGWQKTTAESEIIYTAERTPNAAYFSGNVFQIVLRNAAGEPISTGSGFVFHEDGWFITNNHVMENGYSATAYFDIPDRVQGTKHTTLAVPGGVYHDETKDVFIGKLENYEKIRSHYHPISFTEEYTQGETCYSIGYPLSSITMEINTGSIITEYSDIHDKINGVYYVLSDSYIAPGSSGGILVNEAFEVVGITTLGFYTDSTHSVYVSGGSVPTSIFKMHLMGLTDSSLRPLYLIYNT